MLVRVWKIIIKLFYLELLGFGIFSDLRNIEIISWNFSVILLFKRTQDRFGTRLKNLYVKKNIHSIQTKCYN